MSAVSFERPREQREPVAKPRVKLAYLCGQFPAISHTFVLREVTALREMGVEIETFSIRRAPQEHLLSPADRAAAQSTHAILPPRLIALLAAHLRLLASHTGAYFQTLAAALRLAPAGVRGRLWQVFYFVEAVMLWHECEKRTIRHVHAHLANVAADVALLSAQIGSRCDPRQPWSWSLTMHGPTEFFDVGRFRLAEKVRAAEFVVCISDFARSQLMALSDPSQWEKLRVVHVGIPVEQFVPDDEPACKQPPEILCLGRHVPEKGQAVLLQAAALLRARGHDVHLRLPGDGPSRPQLERLASELGLDGGVVFPGAVGQDQLRGLYANASIFCLPSFAEGVPCVLMEAMAMRLPVLTTTIAGIPELIEHERSGLLVSPGRADQLAAAIERLLEQPQLARALAEAGRRHVLREFSCERSAAQLHALFAERLSPATPSSGPAP